MSLRPLPPHLSQVACLTANVPYRTDTRYALRFKDKYLAIINTVNSVDTHDLFLTYHVADKQLNQKVQTDDGVFDIIDLAESTTDQTTALMDEYKYQLQHHILTTGIPYQHFDHTLHVDFSGKQFVFEVEDVSVLDLARYANDDHRHRDDFFTAHRLELASMASVIPAKVGRQRVLYLAGNKAGSDLLDAYSRVVHQYRHKLNLIMHMINDTKLGTVEQGKIPPSRLWQQLYNTALDSGRIQTVFLH